jgi:hypothetical protein
MATICCIATEKRFSGSRTSREAVGFHQLCRPRLHLFTAQQAKASWLTANKQVIRHRHIRQQVHFLVYRPDPQLLGMGGVFGEMALPSSQMVPRSA